MIRATVFAALLLTLGAACSIPTASSLDRLRLLLEVERETVRAGQTVELHLTIRNAGHETVRLTGSSSCPPFGFRIVGTAEQPLMFPGMPRICTADYREWTIRPGGELRHTFRWDGRVQRSDGSMVALAPGEYRLEPQVVGPPAEIRAGLPLRLIVEE